MTKRTIMGLRRSFLTLAMARTISFAQYASATRTWPVIRRRLHSGEPLLQQAMLPSPSNQPQMPPLMPRSTTSRSSPSTGGPLNSRGRHREAAPFVGSRECRRRRVARCTSQAEAFVGSLPCPSRAIWKLGTVAGIKEHLGGAPTTATRQVTANRGVVTMAQPRKKMPERSVDVFCQKCRTKLYKYKKGGKGSLVKCYKERIVEDFTDGKLECPSCGQLFARDTMVHGRPAFKMIGGKVYQKK